MENSFSVGNRQIGAGHPAFITAEIGINHDGDPAAARRMIQAAAQAGADAVKFQAFRADAFVSPKLAKSSHQEAALGAGESVFEMWQRLELSERDFRMLAEYAAELGVIFYASPFDAESVDMLAEIGAPLYKVASGELTNLPLIRRMAQKGLPMVLSVGMASLGEIEAALGVIYASGNRHAALLHCVANYPADPGNVHLRRITRLRQVFGVPVGYSDHTLSIWPSIAAVALGASLLEKHFTLDKTMPGCDHALSADPADLRALVEGVRAVEPALGSEDLTLLENESEGRILFRRSLMAACDIPAGAVLTAAMVAIKRPASGIEPAHLDIALGRTARRDIPAGDPITWRDV